MSDSFTFLAARISLDSTKKWAVISVHTQACESSFQQPLRVADVVSNCLSGTSLPDIQQRR